MNWGYEAIGRLMVGSKCHYPVDNDRKGNRTVVPGDIMYKDQNNDGVINYLDERPIGYRVDSTPTLNLVIFHHGRFDLAMDWFGSIGSHGINVRDSPSVPNDGNSPDEY